MSTRALEVLQAPEFTKDYWLSTRLNPFFLQGDFNGDGALEIAVLVLRHETGKQGIAILHAGSTRPVVIGACNSFGTRGDDFRWNGWSVYSKGPVGQGADGTTPPLLRADAFLVATLEAASGIIYWDGSAYRWYQQGD